MPGGDSSLVNDRLQEAIRDYLDARERGEAPSRKDLLARHPDLASELAGFLDNYEEFRVIGGEERPGLASLPLKPGERLDGYELIEEIGRGGMGVVFKARQVGLDRIVALKLVLAGELASAEESERFRREAAAAARLDHPHIVPIHGIGRHRGLDYYSMRYVEGGTLSRHRERLRGDHPSVARLIETIGRSVEHAHARGVLHRDLKPGNVLLDRDGQPHIVDFGLAKGLFGEKGLTRTGAAVGTPSYMAPEQAGAGRGRDTPATDVYGLGAILYELLTGIPPFRGKTSLEILEQVKQKDPVRPRSLDPSIPLDLESICLKCLEKEPRRRYPSAGELADDVRRFLDGRPVRARRLTGAGRALRTCRRNPVVTGLIGGIVLGQLLLAAGLWRSGVETEASLWRSYLERARASRRSRLPGQRVEGLALLEKAAAIRLHDSLRDEAISCMSRVDAVLRFRAPFLPEGVREGSSHEGPVPAAIDGELRRCARADDEGRVIITVSGESEPIQVLPAASSAVRSLGFSPDGRHVAVRREDGRLEVWALGEELGQKPDLRIALPAPASQPCWDFRPDSREVAIGMPDGRLALHDLPSGLFRMTLGAEVQTGPLLHVRYRPDREALAVCRAAGGPIEVWSGATADRLVRLEPQRPVADMAWQADGDRLAIRCGDEIRLLSLEEREDIVLRAPDGRVDRMALVPRGPLLASSGGDDLRLWSAHSGRELLRMERQALLGFSSDGGSMATVTPAGELAVWKIEEGSEWRSMVRFRSNPGYVYGLSIHAGSRLLAATTQQGAWVIDLASGRELARLPMPGYLGGSALFAPGGDALLLWGEEGLSVWPIALEEPEPSRLRVRFGPPTSVVVAGRGKRIGFAALAGDDRTLAVVADASLGRLAVLDWRSGVPLAELETRKNLEVVALSPDGRRVAAGGKVTGVFFWDLRDPPGSFRQLPVWGVLWLEFSPDGKKLIVGAESEFISLDLSSWTISHRLAKEVPGCAGALSAASDLLAVCDTPTSLKLVHANEGSVLASFATPEAHVARLCFDPSGRWLTVTGASACLYLLDLERVRGKLQAMGIDPRVWPFHPSGALEDPRRLEVVLDRGDPGK